MESPSKIINEFVVCTQETIELMTRPVLIKGIMSKWAGEKHCDAILHLAKTKDKHLTDKIVSALNDSKRDLSNISREDVCRALAVALRGASSEAKLKMSKHLQTLQMHDHSMAFCINTMAS